MTNETIDLSHYTTLRIRYFNEKERLANAKNETEKEMRTVWLKQMADEIIGEEKFLRERGVKLYGDFTTDEEEMSDISILQILEAL